MAKQRTYDHSDLNELMDNTGGWARSRLARFKAPKAVFFGELPKTSTGKI